MQFRSSENKERSVSKITFLLAMLFIQTGVAGIVGSDGFITKFQHQGAIVSAQSLGPGVFDVHMGEDLLGPEPSDSAEILSVTKDNQTTTTLRLNFSLLTGFTAARNPFYEQFLITIPLKKLEEADIGTITVKDYIDGRVSVKELSVKKISPSTFLLRAKGSTTSRMDKATRYFATEIKIAKVR